MTWPDLGPLYRLADRPLVQRALAALFASSARRHLAWLDAVAPPRAQLRTLLGLTHQARNTPFGRDHDFRRVRSVADFRRLVPLRSAAELARHYPRPGDTRPSPRALLAAERRALVTALALVQQARPRESLLAGRIVWLGDGDPAGLFPLLLRPAVCSAAELGSRQPSVLVGPAERLLALAESLSSWPELVGVVSIRRDHREAGPALRQAQGERPVIVELLQLPGGPVAVEDARLGGLRLLPEHGCFFELVPAEAGALPPARLTPDEARVGEVYELALSSAAGLWACRTGLHLMFDPKGRPRVVAALAAPVRRDLPAAAPAPHRPTAGTPAARPGTPFRSPWSAPADRG